MNPSNYQRTKDDFITYLKSRSFTKSSIQSRVSVFRLYWKWLTLENLEADKVSYNELLSFMKWCNKNGATQRTIQNYMGTIKHLYEHFIREEKITKNPATDITVKGVKRKVLYHILEPHELQALYNNYQDETPKGSRDKIMLGLLINQGLKTEELVKLEVRDINLREGKITVPGGSRSNSREMKMESHQVMDMYDYVLKSRSEILGMNPKRTSQSKIETEKLFIGEGGNHQHFGNYMTRLLIKVRKINPNVLNAKQIRTSVITKWLKMYNLREVQYLAGHRYISSTESYLQKRY
jgi:site-specific recombinase XerD